MLVWPRSHVWMALQEAQSKQMSMRHEADETIAALQAERRSFEELLQDADEDRAALEAQLATLNAELAQTQASMLTAKIENAAAKRRVAEGPVDEDTASALKSAWQHEVTLRDEELSLAKSQVSRAGL